MRRSASVVAFVGFLAGAAFDTHALFIVNQPWVKPGTRNTEGSMIRTSTEGATRIGVRSSIAARVSLCGVREEIAVDAEVRTEWHFDAERRAYRH